MADWSLLNHPLANGSIADVVKQRWNASIPLHILPLEDLNFRYWDDDDTAILLAMPSFAR